MTDTGITYESDGIRISTIETPGLPTLKVGDIIDARSYIQINPWEFVSYSIEHRALYLNALAGHKCDYANGPLGGWADAHRNLVKLGWKEVIRDCGCREYVTIVKPLTVYDIIDMSIYTDEGKAKYVKVFYMIQTLFGTATVKQLDGFLSSVDESLFPTLKMVEAISNIKTKEIDE